ncbi:MAG TPA: tetratricopeptide repeat protein [Gemmatirosa sp.]
MSDARDPMLADAANRHAELEARLRVAATAADGDTRAALRSEIVALIRELDARVQAWRSLADSARGLPELWKRLPPEARADATARANTGALPNTLAPVPAVGSARRDHLGASTFVAKGWSAYAAADFDGAAAAFDRALALAPGDAEASALLAWAYAACGRDDDALLAAQQVLAVQGRGAAASLARVAVGRVCLAKQIVGEAIEHLARAARDDDDRRATLYATYCLGLAYRQRAMHGDAIAFLRRALSLGPNLVEARYELGCTLWCTGAHAAAEDEWRAGAAAPTGAWAARCRARLQTSAAVVAAGA